MRQARDALQSMRSRLAPLLASEANPLAVDKLLETEFARLCADLSAGEYGSH